VVVGFGPSGADVAGADTVGGTLLKASDSPRGQVQLRKQTEVLRALHADERLHDWHALLPTIVGEGDIGGSYCVLESRLPGSGGLEALTDPARRRTYRSSAIATISEMHRATAELTRIGDDELRRWVREPMAIVVSALPRAHRASALALDAVIAERLRGALVATAWTHGDYTADNILSDGDGRTVAIVDWCDGDPAGLAVLDVVSFLLTSDVAIGGAELGGVVLDRLADARQPDGDLLVRVQRNLGGDVLGPDLLTLLGWLQHVSHNLAKSPSYAANPVWVRRNLVPVVRAAQLT
jgi:hypothetical protein